MNFQISQGVGTTIATDTGGGGENYQKIKMIDATPGSTAGTGIAANPLQVSLQFTAANTVPLLIDGSGSIQPISAVSLPLPTGASTEATLLNIETDLNQFTFLAGKLVIDGSTVTQPISGTISALQSGSWNINDISGTISLPTGAATSANQTTGNSSLSSIDGKTPALGQALAAASSPVVLTAAQITTLTPLSTVIANIGTSGSLALDVSITALQIAQASTTPGQKGTLDFGAVTTAAPVYTTGQSNALSLDTSGNLRVTFPTASLVTTNLNGITANKTRVMQVGSLTTASVAADQVVLTYTVTALKTFFLEYVSFQARFTTLPGNVNPVLLGNISLEIVSGTKVITFDVIHATTQPAIVTFSDPLPIAAGTVVRIVTTPNAVTSFVWRGSFGGYEV